MDLSHEPPVQHLNIILKDLIRIHLNSSEVGLLPPNDRLIATRELNLINEVMRYQDAKSYLKMQQQVWAQWEDSQDFLDKVSGSHKYFTHFWLLNLCMEEA